MGADFSDHDERLIVRRLDAAGAGEEQGNIRTGWNMNVQTSLSQNSVPVKGCDEEGYQRRKSGTAMPVT